MATAAQKSQRAHDKHKTADEVVLVLSEARDPALLASKTLEMNPEPVYVALDLPQLKLPPAEALKWIECFTYEYRCLAEERELDDLPPSVAVFVDAISAEDKRSLHAAEAVIFERSLMSDDDCKTPSELRKKLAAEIEEDNKIPDEASPETPAREMSQEQRRALNSYPEGVTPAQIDQLIDEMNSGRAADPEVTKNSGRTRSTKPVTRRPSARRS